jgi:N-acetylglucosaminyldiphosphoundecaprenol N-acetyl-beta-D-mannosaminyltransferase
METIFRIKTVNICGTKFSLVNYKLITTVIEKRIKKRSDFICVASVHSLIESINNRKLQSAMNKSLFTTTDGMPIVWLSRFLVKQNVTRVYGPTLMLKLCALAENRKLRIFLLGGYPGIKEKLKNNLVKKYPKIIIAGCVETPVRPVPNGKNLEIINQIKKSNADIIFVGMGCPFQEKWMTQNYQKVTHGLFIGVGAAFDFISGRVKQSPKWMQKAGLEWFFRLCQEPKRLGIRYLVTNTKFILLILTKFNKFYETEDIIS